MVSIKKLMKEPGICSIPLAILWWVDLPITYKHPMICALLLSDFIGTIIV